MSVPIPADHEEPALDSEARLARSRFRAVVVAAVAFLALIAVAVTLPVPYVKLAPGPTYNTIGDVDGKPLVEVEGDAAHPTYPVSGELDMTTILESGGPRGGLNLFTALAGWVNPSDSVMPREVLYPDDISGDEVKRQNAVMFSTSQSYAVSAALRHLGIPVAELPVIAAIVVGSPAEGKLQLQDQVLKVDDVAVSTPSEVGDAIRAKPPGTTFAIEVLRSGQTQTVDVTSAPKADDPAVGEVGIAVDTLFEGPFPIRFSLEGIGGPSAGMMFSLAIVDKLTPEDLAGGRHIAGTGTIDPLGNVGAIGGIRQKLAGASAAGAELFLIPRVHCEEAQGYVPDGLTVVPIDTLDQAVAAVTAWREGRALDSCPA